MHQHLSSNSFCTNNLVSSEFSHNHQWSENRRSWSKINTASQLQGASAPHPLELLFFPDQPLYFSPVFSVTATSGSQYFFLFNRQWTSRYQSFAILLPQRWRNSPERGWSSIFPSIWIKATYTKVVANSWPNVKKDAKVQG